MPEDNPSINSVPSINAAAALAAVQAAQIKRLEQQQQQQEAQQRAEAASPPLPLPPLSSASLSTAPPAPMMAPPSAAEIAAMQQEAAQATQAYAAEQRAAHSALLYSPADPRYSAPVHAASVRRWQQEQALASDWAYFQKQPAAAPALSGRFGPDAGFGDEFHVSPEDARLEADLFSRVPQQQAHERRREHFAGMGAAPPDPDPLGTDWFEDRMSAPPMTRDLHAEGFAVGDPTAGPRYANYGEAQARRQAIETGLRDRYATEGRVPEIGKPVYQQELQGQLAEEELAAPRLGGLPGVKQRMGEEWNSPYGKLNWAFAGGDVLQGMGKLYAANNSGAYVTPEQQETAQAGLLPGVGALVGTALGGWGGGIVGGGVGQLAEGVIGANEAREGVAREASERLAASLGQAADTAGRFKDIMEATGASTQAVAQGLAALQASGPGVGAQAIAGAGRSALSEGEYYAADTAATSKFLSSDPALAPLAQTYRTQGELTRGQYQSIASLALAEGDMGEFNTAQMQASRAPLAKDAQYQQLAKNQVQNASSWANKANHFLTETGHHLGFQWLGMSDEDPIVQDQLALNKRKAEVDAQTGADDQKYVSEYADLNRGKQNLFDAGLQTKIGEAGFSLAQLRGASASRLRGLLPGLNASSQAAVAADQLLIDTDTKMMSGLAADDPTRAGFQNLINSARAELVQHPVADAQRDRLVFDTEQQEQSAEYGLTRSASQMGLLTGRLAGRTNAEMQGQEDILLGSQRAYAGQQRQDAASPLVRPAERSAMLAQANALDADAAQQQYGFRMSGYAQTLGLIDNRTAEAGLGITQAKSFGTSDEVYSAQGREADALAAKMRELTSEIARGGMTFEDMTGKVRQNTQAAEQQAQVLAQRRDDHLAASASNADSDFTLGTAGLSRRVRSGGTGAVDFDAVNAGFQGKFRADQEAIDNYAVGDPRHKAAQARMASDQAASRDYEGNLLAYAPSVKLGMEGVAAEDALGRERHAFRREMLAPYRSGDEGSDPLTRGAGLERAIGGSLAFLGKEEADAGSERRRRQGQVGADGKPLWDNIAEQGYQRQLVGFHEQKDSLLDEREQIKHDRNFAMLRALPETIIGGGGTGNSVSSFSFDALSAAYSPNVMQGSWGSPRRRAGVSLPGSMPGNAVEAFQAYSGSHQGGGTASTTTTLTAAIQQLGHGMNTNQMAALLQQVVTELQNVARNTSQRGGGQAGPPGSFGSTAKQALDQTFNSNRPGR